MADDVRMALAELLRKAEQNGDVDFLREGVRVLSQALMEAGGQPAPGRRALRADGRAERAAQRLPRAGVGHAGGHDRAAGAAGARWQLLPGAAGAAQAGGAGAGGGGAGGVRPGGLDAAGG